MTCRIFLRTITFTNHRVLVGMNSMRRFIYCIPQGQIQRANAKCLYARHFSTNSVSNVEKADRPDQQENLQPLSLKSKLKRAVAEYGSTVIVFHIGISLVSLGTCYVLVSSGIDMGKLLTPYGASGTIVANAGTFVTAYAIHKVFAPVRISITLASAPFIVRYLRHIGILKKT